MTATAWMKWYPGDWRADPLVRACSELSRYVWFEMLGIMHEAQPRGFLLIGRRPVSPATLAAIIGSTLAVVEPALAELEGNGVFSKNARGIIYSRRMIRDEKRLAANARGGRKGGVLSRDEGKGIFATPPPTPPHTPHATPGPTPPATPELKAESRARGGQIPDTRYQKPEAAQQPASAREARRSWTEAEVDHVLDRAFAASGIDRDSAASAPGLLDASPLLRKIEEGFDLEGEIVPLLCSRGKPGIRSWSYFVGPLVEARERKPAGSGAVMANGAARNGSGGGAHVETEDEKWRVRVDHYRRTRRWLAYWGERDNPWDVPAWALAEFDAIDKGEEAAEPAPLLAARPTAA